LIHFITLTLSQSETSITTHIRADSIQRITPFQTGSYILLDGASAQFHVKENPEEVFKKICSKPQ